MLHAVRYDYDIREESRMISKNAKKKAGEE
jgi:hypothetical protein